MHQKPFNSEQIRAFIQSLLQYEEDFFDSATPEEMADELEYFVAQTYQVEKGVDVKQIALEVIQANKLWEAIDVPFNDRHS